MRRTKKNEEKFEVKHQKFLLQLKRLLQGKDVYVCGAALTQVTSGFMAWIISQESYPEEEAIKAFIKLVEITIREDLQKANDVLVNLVFHLHSEYPVATLHDCNESTNENPVVLGKTILGSFKN